LPGIIEQHEAHRPGDVNQIFRVEQQALVAADNELRDGIPRTDAPEVEPANAVLAAEEEVLEDRQLFGVGVGGDVFDRRPEPEAQT
jgi:hypothetical protein